MKRWCSFSAPLLAIIAGLVPVCPAAAESMISTGGQGASARLTLRVVIPSMVKLQEDIHPSEVDAGVANQKLVIQTNLRKGFCAALRLASPEATSWNVRVAAGDNVWLQAAGDGYRLCSNGPGQHTVHLEHQFDTSGALANRPLAWPVRMEITSL
jgi:hypothetical protein